MNYTKNEIIVLGISFAVMILIATLLGILLKNKSEKIKKIPLLVITIILLVLEVIKQVIEFSDGEYNLWSIPLHFCSTYFIWFSFANFSKGKFSEHMRTLAFVASFYLVICFYVKPSDIIGNACDNIFSSFYTFHTFFFHHLVLLYFWCSLTLKQFNFKYKHALTFIIAMAIYYSFTVLIANLIDVNFMNTLYSNIPFMENLRLSAGQVVYNIVLGSLTFGVGAIIILMCSLITQKIKKKKGDFK